MTLFLKAKENIIMANYEIDPAILLPFAKGVELDLFDGKLTSVLLVLCLRIPNCLYDHSWFGTFEEINLRFYVVRKEGNTVKRGVVFINETFRILLWL
jgi:uncharacterized protein YqjF (DUF2071 family)